MKIALLSDLHGILPYIPRKTVDCVLIAGDICPDAIIPVQGRWFNHQFLPWLNTLSDPIWTAGNHDFYLDFHKLGTPHNIYTTYAENLYAYTFPYVTCNGWAFHKTEKEIEMLLTRGQKFDIMVCHAPPFMVCDRSNREPAGHVGSMAIREFIEEVQPKLCVFGHIHEGYGHKMLGNTLCINASFQDERRVPRMRYLVLDTKDMSIDIVPCEEWFND